MIASLAFSIVAAGLVFLAGRKDAARDPKLTVSLLVLLAVIPVLAAAMPKINVLPALAESARETAFPWGKMLAMAWALGFAIAVARLGIAATSLRRWRNHALEVDRIDGVAICELQGLQGPVAAGVWNPSILVPATWQTWPDEHKRIVLEHELAHHRRRDPLWRLLAELACAVHWYHPLARWMKRRFVMQCEYACDARVLAKGIDPKTYASVLCDFASHGSPSPLAPAMAETGSLESRVRRMLRPPRGHGGRTLALLALLGALTACSLSMIGRENPQSADIPAAEVELRWTANPFPDEP